MRRKRAAGEPQWFFRRIVAMGVIGFAAWRLMMLESAPDTRVNETIAWGWILLLATVVLGYLGFASAQDIAAIFATRSGTPYAPPDDPSDPPERTSEPPRNFAG